MFDAILLGLIQGLTEFLPVSSSGHLVLTEHLLGKHEESMIFELLLHLGTLFAVLLVFRKELLTMIQGLLKKDPIQMKKALFIIVACIPTGIIGILFEKKVEALSNYPTIICALLFFTGFILFSVKNKKEGEKEMSIKLALLLGVVQGLAILPGISRSGSTIAVCLLLGLKRKESGEFSFLISIPVIAGAAFLKLLKADDAIAFIDTPTLVSVFVAFVSGFVSLVYLLKFVQKGQLHRFAYYLWPISIIGFFLLK